MNESSNNPVVEPPIKNNIPIKEVSQIPVQSTENTAINEEDTQKNERYKSERHLDHIFKFVLNDYDQVHREIIDIKSCRTNIFMGTMGVIGAVAVGILGIIGLKENVAPIYAWLPLAAAVPIGLLTSSILATIHKARGINERVGYMMAIAESLVKEEVPRFFTGWHTSKIVLEHCQIYLNTNNPKIANCPLKEKVEQKKEKRKEPLCFTKARIDASTLSKELNLLPPMLHSFTSFSTYIYCAAYFISVIFMLLAMTTIVKNFVDNFDMLLYWLSVLLGFTVTWILGFLAVRNKKINDRSGVYEKEREKITTMEVVLKIYTFFAALLFPSLLLAIGLIKEALFNPGHIMMLIFVYGIGFVGAAIAMSIAYGCYDKICSLRKGRYSIERWYHLWKACFENCPLMDIRTETI
jgi:hypothetical protein